VLPRVLKKLAHLETNPLAGQPLGRRSQSNLTMFRKITVGNRDWRIIYRVEDDETLVIIWVIASRTDEECYAEATRRITRAGLPETATLLDVLSHLSERAHRKAMLIFKPEETE
jgi:mRNA interferase RelE/StbE